MRPILALLTMLVLPFGLRAAEPDEANLLQVLASSTSTEEKAMACDTLGRMGTAQSVAALAALLPNADLHDYARDALTRIPDPAAPRALLEALPKLDGREQAGVVISLGELRMGEAVQALVPLTGSQDATLADAAIIALGQIANAPAIKALEDIRKQGAPARQETATHALLLANQRSE